MISFFLVRGRHHFVAKHQKSSKETQNHGDNPTRPQTPKLRKQENTRLETTNKQKHPYLVFISWAYLECQRKHSTAHTAFYSRQSKACASKS